MEELLQIKHLKKYLLLLWLLRCWQQWVFLLLRLMLNIEQLHVIIVEKE